MMPLHTLKKMKTTLLLSITFGLISALPLPINGVDDAIRAAANNGDDAIRAVDQNGQVAAHHPAGQVDNVNGGNQIDHEEISLVDSVDLAHNRLDRATQRNGDNQIDHEEISVISHDEDDIHSLNSFDSMPFGVPIEVLTSNPRIRVPQNHGQALPPGIPQPVFGHYDLGLIRNRIHFRSETYLVGSGPDAISREEIIRLFREATAAASQRGHTVIPVETMVGDNLLKVQFRYWRPWTPQEIAAGKRLFE
jgi:hypothetical protein